MALANDELLSPDRVPINQLWYPHSKVGIPMPFQTRNNHMGFGGQSSIWIGVHRFYPSRLQESMNH